MKTFAIFLLSKGTFTIRTCSILESCFRKLLSKATFERKLASVSLALERRCLHTYMAKSVALLSADNQTIGRVHPVQLMNAD